MGLGCAVRVCCLLVCTLLVWGVSDALCFWFLMCIVRRVLCLIMVCRFGLSLRKHRVVVACGFKLFTMG